MDGEKRVQCAVGIGDILIVGEQFRVQIRTDHSHLFKDHRYIFKTYPACFTGSDLVDTIISNGQAPDREVAVILLNILLENNILHNIVNEGNSFKDDSQLYRFRKDDGTFPYTDDLVTFMRAKRLFQRLMCDKRPSFVTSHEEDGQTYPSSFMGCHLVDWLVTNQETESRSTAVKDMRYLLQNHIIRHVADIHHFKDEQLLYEFCYDFGRDRVLMDLVLPPAEVEVDGATQAMSALSVKSQATETPQQDSISIKRPSRTESGYHSDQVDDGSDGASPSNSSAYDPAHNCVNLTPGSSFLIRKASAKELQDPNSNYVKRHIRIASDPVGFGFVIRGDGPVYVKTVDPTGPAAVAGLKVGHYLLKVNEKPVLHMKHQALAHVILENFHYVSLVVMEHVSSDQRRTQHHV